MVNFIPPIFLFQCNVELICMSERIGIFLYQKWMTQNMISKFPNKTTQYVMLNTSTKNIYSNLLLKNKRVSVEDPGSGWHIPNFVLKKISSIIICASG
jgi:hypothetical protein